MRKKIFTSESETLKSRNNFVGIEYKLNPEREQ